MIAALFQTRLTGQVPFVRDNAVDTCVAHVKEKFPSISKIMPSCPKEIEDIINKCTKKEPKDRYSNVEEFYNALCSVKNGRYSKNKNKGFFARLFGGKKWEDK